MGHAHFSNDKIRISRVPVRPSTVFFSCRTPTRKAGLEVCGWSLCTIFNPEKKPTLRAAFAIRMVCSHGSVCTDKDRYRGLQNVCNCGNGICITCAIPNSRFLQTVSSMMDW